MPIPAIPPSAPLPLRNIGTAVKSSLPFVVEESSGALSPVPRFAAKFNMATNYLAPTTKTELTATVDGSAAFTIPAGTLNPSRQGAVVRIKLAFGFNAPQPDIGCNITVETASGVLIWKAYVMPRFVGQNPSDTSQCLEIDGWVRSTGGVATNIDLQSHFEWRLLGYQRVVVNDDFQYGSAAWENFPSASGFDSTIDNPLKVYIQWDAPSTIAYWDIKQVSTRSFGIASSSGCFVRTSNRGLLTATPQKWATFAELDGQPAMGFATDGIKTVIVGSAGYISVSLNGGKSFVPNLTRPTTQDLHDVVWCSGLSLWIAVGNAGTVLTSPDGATWTSRTSGATADIWRVRYSTTVGVVAVANAATNNYLTSTNGTTWNAATLSTAFSPRGIALNGTNILVCGSSGNIGLWNGTSWTFSTAGTSILLGAVFTLSKYVICGSAGALYYSANGTSGWTSGTWTGGNTQSMYSIESNGTIVGACGNQGALWSSSDGITFTKIASSFAGTIFGDVGRLEI